jgi:GTP cyclohydrolase I
VAYFSTGKVIGLSKINRLVHYYARRPQVQERLTKQIAEGLQEALHTKDVAVIVDAAHLCVSMRGVQDHGGTTITASYGGVFEHENVRSEFLKYLEISNKTN